MDLYKAFLKIADKQLSISFYSIEFSRKTDPKGRPCTPTIGGRISFSTEATEDTFLAELATNSQNRPFHGKLVFHNFDTNTTLREIDFKDAYVVYYKEECNIKKSYPMIITCTLSARIITIGPAY